MSNTVISVCPNCHKTNEADAIFCTFCGTKLKDKPGVTPPEKPFEQSNPYATACPNCHKTNEADATFCTGCGTKLKNKTPPTKPSEKVDPSAETLVIKHLLTTENTPHTLTRSEIQRILRKLQDPTVKIEQYLQQILQISRNSWIYGANRLHALKLV